ncbi:hypothetical protein [Deinococcus sonorensis]|uniref:TetR family transcriptional regulator n=2 Tax=Deinococcus sonorensis TaxID=309891 RepID=A0AAU7UDG0_9DEIO
MDHWPLYELALRAVAEAISAAQQRGDTHEMLQAHHLRADFLTIVCGWSSDAQTYQDLIAHARAMTVQALVRS